MPRTRIPSIDILRGAVMVLMAIDHVRVYAGVPAGGPTMGVFLTRWVTHFCAPVFAFLAGTSIFLRAERSSGRGALTRRLFTRGAWFVFLELTFLRLAWTFNFDYEHYTLGGVIWMLGWCMILMGFLVHLPVKANAAIGLGMIAGQDLLAAAFSGVDHPLWRILYTGGSIGSFAILYSLIPWIGVMSAGYAFGAVLRLPGERRHRVCLSIGLAACAAFLASQVLFLVLRPDPRTPAWIQLLSARKYPASLSFLLMTLGPAIALLPLLERAHGRLADWLGVFGRAPMFYYLLHIPLIHIVAVGISCVRTPQATNWLTGNFPLRPAPVPEGYMWSLGLLYLVTAAVVVALYFPCRWYTKRKAPVFSTAPTP